MEDGSDFGKIFVFVRLDIMFDDLLVGVFVLFVNVVVGDDGIIFIN